MNVDVAKAGSGSVYNESSPAITLPSAATDTLEITTPFTPGATASDLGDYTFTFDIQQTETDENPGDNMVTAEFKVTDTVFAREYGVLGSSVGPDNYTCCVADGSEIGLIYEFSKADMARSISFYIANNTTTANGLTVFANLYKISINGDFSSTPIAQSDIFDVTSNEVNTWVTLPFTAPAQVDPDSTYVASLGIFGLDAGDVLRVGEDLTVNQPEASVAPTTFVYGGAWYWIPNVPMIRLNTTSTVGVDEITERFNLNLYPNPATDAVNVYANTLPAEPITLTLTNLLGEVVMTRTVSPIMGQINERIALNNLDNGIYMLRMQGADWEKTMKVVHNR
ncbi:MAG: T9SS type A sorting domain-containing protein [Flavobacteriales bacterium]|nr:T9SS type A sorting domain-containing protein [Flavobacteriales bacterium]